MKNRWTKTMLITALAVLLIAVGAIAAFAQDDDTPAPKPHGYWQDERQNDLAEALGITVEELEAAQKEAEMARITRAVDEGYLTTDQGNLMLALVTLKDSLDRHVLLASALGLTVEELDAAVEDGSLQDLLADMTPAELHDGMQEAFEAALEQAVDDLLITEEQADMVREHMEGGMGYHGQRFGGHGMGGYGRGGHHGGMGMGWVVAWG